MSRKKVKAQQRIFKELEKQLFTQADRLGIRHEFTPMKLKEIEFDAVKKHLLSFYAERSNLEYEMQMLGTNKRDTLIKLERLGVYIKRAERMKTQYEEKMQEMLEKMIPENEKVKKATRHKGISVKIGGDN